MFHFPLQKHSAIRMLLVALFLVSVLPTSVLAAPLTQESIDVIDGPELIIMAAIDGPEEITVPDDVESVTSAEESVSAAMVTVGTASFTVNFRGPGNQGGCSGTLLAWPAAAQTAFLHAVSIWEGLINSREPIVIDACWKQLGAGVLGSAGPRLLRDWGGGSLPMSGTWYPFGLADALAGQDLVSGRDITASFNDDFTNWYFGTDGVTPAGQYDFVSVVLHEIGHGLGVSGGANYNPDTGTGAVVLGTYPVIYSQFTKDGNGVSLLNGYTQNSTALGNALRGLAGGVFFHGSSAIAANGGNPVPLYTPSTWSSGSSYSHLAESFNLTTDDLMTFSIGSGRSQHTVGPVTLGLLKDIGWPANNDTNMTRGLGSFTYDPETDNAPFDNLGTLAINFDFTHMGSDNLLNFYLVVNTANSATLNNATTVVNNGGINSILAVPNSGLPGDNLRFDNGETLTLPMVVDIADAPWGLNFDVFASDEVSAAGVRRSLGSFTIDSSMFEGRILQPKVYIPLFGN